jgi:hypothetical protein
MRGRRSIAILLIDKSIEMYRIDMMHKEAAELGADLVVHTAAD